VVVRTYLVWKEGPWDLPVPKVKTTPVADQEIAETKTVPLVGTDVIVSKNLFDPERGEGRNREAETNSRAFQRVRSMVLLGTAILGSNRYAVLRDPGPSAVPGQFVAPQAANLMRLKLGDNVEGFRVSEIGDKRVVFTKGTANVEVLLDYFRPEPLPPRPAVPGQVGVQRPTGVPRIPPQGPNVAPPSQVVPTPVPGQVPLAPRVLPNLPRRPVPQRNQPVPQPNQ
jgi:hypothetical protein